MKNIIPFGFCVALIERCFEFEREAKIKRLRLLKQNGRIVGIEHHYGKESAG